MSLHLVAIIMSMSPAAGDAVEEAAAPAAPAAPIIHTVTSFTECSIERLFEEFDRSFAALVMLSIGMKDENGKTILDVNDDPWKSLQSSRRNRKKQKQIKPSLDIMRKHIIWRWVNVCKSTPPMPRPRQWPQRQVVEWLEKNPINSTNDILFLTSTIAKEKQLAFEALEKEASENDLLSRSWTGELPYLRLIHALIDHDDIKELFLHRNDLSGDRLEIENRNSTERRQATVWDKLAEKWNDPLYNPVSEEIPELHSRYIVSLDLGHKNVADMSPATPEKCQSKFSSLIVQMNRRIALWEQSGQGDGGGNNDDEEEDDEEGKEDRPSFGSFRNRPAGALDQRHAFFDYEQQYLLYLWFMLEKHDLLGCSLQRLDEGVAAGDGGRSVPIIDVGSVLTASAAASAAGSLATNEDGDNPRAELNKLSSTIKEMVQKDALQQEKNRAQESVYREKTYLRKLKGDIRELEVKCHECRNDLELSQLYKKQLGELQAECAELQEELNSLSQAAITDNPTPKRAGGTPASARGSYSGSKLSSPDFDSD